MNIDSPRLALDAMGGDFAPQQIIEGARLAREEMGLSVVLVGRPDALVGAEDFETVAASEVVEMADENAAQSVRRLKDASVVRAAEAVRDGRAEAMVSAGNTGGAMAAALLRMGRIKGVSRPAIATPIPVPGATPTVLLDAGANAECVPAYLVQFARMGSVFATHRYGIAEPRVGLLANGEEKSKGTPLVRETHELLTDLPGIRFIGNVEGRDIMTADVDVVVTDGFTGNVALKTLEGALKALVKAVFGSLGSLPQEHADAAITSLLPLAGELDPDAIGGALLLGVGGVCVISHGSSNAKAIKSALGVARDMVRGGLVDHLRAAMRDEASGAD